MEAGLAVVTGRMLGLLPQRARALADGPAAIELDATDVEMYGRQKRGVAYKPPGAAGRPRCAAPWPAAIGCPGIGAGSYAHRRRVLRRRAAHDEHMAFEIGAKRIAPPWRLLAGISGDGWHAAIDMEGPQVAVPDYCPDWRPANTTLVIGRVRLDPAQGLRRPAVAASRHILAGHGVRGSKAMIATLRWRLIAAPARLVRHGRQLILRPPRGCQLFAEVLARLPAQAGPASRAPAPAPPARLTSPESQKGSRKRGPGASPGRQHAQQQGIRLFKIIKNCCGSSPRQLPLTFYPAWLAALARIVPTTLGIEATGKMLFHGASLGGIWADGTLPWLLAYTLGLIAAGAALFARNYRMTLRDGRLG